MNGKRPAEKRIYGIIAAAPDADKLSWNAAFYDIR
jgi:hypothetical protein